MKTKFFFTILILPLLFIRCKDVESFSYSEDDLKMIDVLVDVFTINAALREIGYSTQKDSLKRTYFQQVYELHDIDSLWLTVQKSRLDNNPIRMDSVYTRAYNKTTQLVQEQQNH